MQFSLTSTQQRRKDHTLSALANLIASRIGRVAGTLAKDRNHISWKVANLGSAVSYYLANQAHLLRQRLVRIANAPNASPWGLLSDFRSAARSIRCVAYGHARGLRLGGSRVARQRAQAVGRH